MPVGWGHGETDRSSSYLEHLIGPGTGSGSEGKDELGPFVRVQDTGVSFCGPKMNQVYQVISPNTALFLFFSLFFPLLLFLILFLFLSLLLSSFSFCSPSPTPVPLGVYLRYCNRICAGGLWKAQGWDGSPRVSHGPQSGKCSSIISGSEDSS